MTRWLWIIGGFYLAALVVATIYSRRRTRTADDYVLAGSNVGFFLGFLTYAATVFSTFTLMGMPDFFRAHGVGAWIFLAVSDGGQVFLIIAIGLHLRRRVAQKGFKGMAGLLSACYGNRWGGYIYFAGAFLFLVPYVAIQIRGIGIFLNAAFPDTLPVWGWSTAIVIVLLVYSEIGGLKAIIYSDAMQGVLLMTVTWIVALGCIRNFGGVGAMFEQVRQTNEALLSTPGPHGLFDVQFLVASFLAITLYPFTQPQVTVRIVIMRDGRAMRRMAVAVGVFAIALILATIPIGMYGAVFYAEASVSDFLTNVLLFDQAPVIGATVAVGLIAAAMSTADSQIFALGAEVRSLLSGTERAVMLRTKLAIVFFALAALVFAIFSSDQLVLLARVSFAGTALLAPLVLGAILSRHPPGVEVIVATALMMCSLFLRAASWYAIARSALFPLPSAGSTPSFSPSPMLSGSRSSGSTWARSLRPR